MSKITASSDMTQAKPEELAKFMDLFCQNVDEVINGGLDFASNFNCQLLNVTFPAGNTDASFPHNLKRVPAGYIVTSATAPATVYAGGGASSATTLTLRASAPATIGLLIY